MKFHRLKAVDGRLRRAQKGHMPQGHAVRHQGHGHMAVMPFCHEVPHRVRNVRELCEQFSVLRPEPRSPAEGRGRVRLWMAEHQRRVALRRVVSVGYGLQVVFREGLRTPGAVREGARAGDFDPFVRHKKASVPLHCDRKTEASPGRDAFCAGKFP